MLELAGRWQKRLLTGQVTVEQVTFDELVAEHAGKDLRHLDLLLHRAAVLDGEDDGIGRSDEGTLVDHLDHSLEADLAGEGAAVVYDRIAVVAVPHVQLDAAAAAGQCGAVDFGGGLAL